MGGLRKQYLELLDEPVLVHALRPFLAHPSFDLAVVALPAEDADAPPGWLVALDARVRVVAGGAARGDSVRNALGAVPEGIDIVMVHDAARPLVTVEVIDRALAVAARGTGAVVAIPVADTLKEVDDAGRIIATRDRSRFRRAQTPQAFPRRMLLDAYRLAAREGVQGTDDASLVERSGGQVVVVDGSPENLKVTTPADVALAEAILRRRMEAARR